MSATALIPMPVAAPATEMNRSFRQPWPELDGKTVLPDVHRGVILDISYNGVLAQLEGDVPAQTDIKLDLNLALAGGNATDVYARVLRIIERRDKRLASIEFTSVGVQSTLNIRRFVQLLTQDDGTT